MAAPKRQLRPWPADKVERWKLTRIKPYPRNARVHSDQQIATIAASMERFGVTTPVLVDDKGVLIFGHGRLRAAQSLGYDTLPVSVAHGWPDADKKAYRLADNQMATLSTWDDIALKDEMLALRDLGFDLPLMGFSAEHLDSIFDGWSSDINVIDKHGSHTDGFTVNIEIEVDPADVESAKTVIGAALTGRKIKYEFAA